MVIISHLRLLSLGSPHFPPFLSKTRAGSALQPAIFWFRTFSRNLHNFSSWISFCLCPWPYHFILSSHWCKTMYYFYRSPVPRISRGELEMRCKHKHERICCLISHIRLSPPALSCPPTFVLRSSLLMCWIILFQFSVCLDLWYH